VAGISDLGRRVFRGPGSLRFRAAFSIVAWRGGGGGGIVMHVLTFLTNIHMSRDEAGGIPEMRSYCLQKGFSSHRQSISLVKSLFKKPSTQSAPLEIPPPHRETHIGVGGTSSREKAAKNIPWKKEVKCTSPMLRIRVNISTLSPTSTTTP